MVSRFEDGGVMLNADGAVGTDRIYENSVDAKTGTAIEEEHPGASHPKEDEVVQNVEENAEDASYPCDVLQMEESEPVSDLMCSDPSVVLPDLNGSARDGMQPELEHIDNGEKPCDVHFALFKSGITCTDAPTAVEILKTRYQLSDVTIHKNMITWSRWNIADVIRSPHNESPFWKAQGMRRKLRINSKNDKEILQEEPPDTDLSDGEIEEMCEKIDLKEKEIARLLSQQEAKADENVSPKAAPTQSIGPIAEIISIEPEVTTQSDHRPATTSSEDQSKPGTASKRPKQPNIFHRMLRALRRRFSRQHTTTTKTSSTTATTTTTNKS